MNISGEILNNETPCLEAGGICVTEGSCEEDKIANGTGLCPEQENKGAVCCHGSKNCFILHD